MTNTRRWSGMGIEGHWEPQAWEPIILCHWLPRQRHVDHAKMNGYHHPGLGDAGVPRFSPLWILPGCGAHPDG